MLDSEFFPIVKVPFDAPEGTEEMGTKEKFWFDNNNYLFKTARINTGEDWAEKIASELCHLLNLPHAKYELAIFERETNIKERGSITYKIPGDVIPGNIILAQSLQDYPQESRNLSQHNLDNIYRIFQDNSVKPPLNWRLPSQITTAFDVFIGYLLLDAWIGNSDRHHENWAFIRTTSATYLSPTYDHASSLGRNESDQKKHKRLTTKDRGFFVKAYVEKCQSCLYANNDDKPLKTLDAFSQAAQYNPTAACEWLNNLANISMKDTLTLFQKIPPDRISEISIQFAQKILEINQNHLLELRDILL